MFGSKNKTPKTKAGLMWEMMKNPMSAFETLADSIPEEKEETHFVTLGFKRAKNGTAVFVKSHIPKEIVLQYAEETDGRKIHPASEVVKTFTGK